MIQVIAYAAKSTDEGEAASLDRQVAEIRRAVEREGERVVVREFRDNDASAFRAKGPDGLRGLGAAHAYTLARQLAAQGEKVEVWVFRSDRLARGDAVRGKHLVDHVTDARRGGYGLRSVTDDMAVTNIAFAGMTGEQNHGYSESLSQHVRSAKERDRAEGRRMGGPVPDGYMVDPDSIVIVKGRVVRRNYVADPKRAPVILELFALAEQGLGDATVSRRLNQLGHRRKSGEPFDRRCVQDIICRPMYCGIHSTAVEGEVVLYPATDTKPLITIERWEAIMAARKQRDVSKSGREGGVANAKGRSTIHFALSRLARCGRCGRGMRCKPDSYVRKDGTKKRYYQCKGRADGAGVCDQPMIDAKAVDTMLIYHLRDYFQDAGVWYESLRNATNLDADVVQQEVSALEAELADIAKAERRGRLKWRNLTASDDPGDEAKADAVVDALAEGTRRAGAASGELDAARARLAALRRATQPTDAMLAYWTRMSEALFGRIKPDSPMGDVNRELHVALDHVVLDTVEETITIQAVQKTTGEVFDAVQVIRGSGNDGTLANVVQVPFVISLDGQVTSMAHGLNPDTVRYEVREPAVPQPPSPDRVAALLQEVGNSWEPWHWGYVHGC